MYHRPPTVLLTVMQPAAQNPFEATRSNDAFDRGERATSWSGTAGADHAPATHSPSALLRDTDCAEIPRPVASVDDTAW